MSGDRQNTNQKPTGKKAKKLSQKEQSERFIKAARELEVDESGQTFLKVINKVLLSKSQD